MNSTCQHPAAATRTRIDRGTWDYLYQVCTGCGADRRVHDDDDNCAVCLDGGSHPWDTHAEACRIPRIGQLTAADAASAADVLRIIAVHGTHSGRRVAAARHIGDLDSYEMSVLCEMYRIAV